jgi:hypothetical protein
MISLTYESRMEDEANRRLWNESREKLAEQRRKLLAVLASRSPLKRGRPREAGTSERIQMAAHFKLLGLSTRKAAKQLAMSYDRARVFYSYHRREIDAEVLRLKQVTQNPP